MLSATDNYEDRFVTAPPPRASPSLPKRQAAPAAPPSPPWHRHPNYQLTEGLTAGQLREVYSKLLGSSPGQLGKERLRAALCHAMVPEIPTSEA